MTYCGRLRTTLMLSVALLAVPTSVGSADIELGAYLAAECVTCHKTSGPADGIPPIVGWPAASFVEALAGYKTGQRNNEVMRNIATRLAPEDMEALAAYFESLASTASTQASGCDHPPSDGRC